MRSMTGYGHAEEEGSRYRVRVTLRSVNHRYLDAVVRLKDEQRSSETALRELLAERLSRGRVDVGVDVEEIAPGESRLEVDQAALTRLSGLLKGLREEGLIERDLVAGDLLRHPQLLRVTEPEHLWEAEDEALLLRVARAALDELVQARETEGGKLAAALGERLSGLRAVAGDLRDMAPVAREEAAAALRDRVRAVVENHAAHVFDEAAEARLAQEVATLADRADVAEEIDRLDAHVAHFEELMGAEGAVGKRLDFLSQEVFRELNTIGSKCRNARMTQSVLDGKVLCEQLREQVQNVE
jgi:uncharacterized protein (TIGR00255 family)